MAEPLQIAGTVRGVLYPPAAPLTPPDFDARIHALRALRLYLASVSFSRRGASPEQPAHFKVPIANILIEQPDDPKELKFPAIAVIPGISDHDAYALGSGTPIEETQDVFGRGTIVVHQAELVEALLLEAWGSHRAERRALMAGLKAALRPIDESQALRLRLPAYFGVVASFLLLESQYIDDGDVIRGRRRGQLRIEMRVPELDLVRFNRLEPFVAVDVEEATDVEGGG